MIARVKRVIVIAACILDSDGSFSVVDATIDFRTLDNEADQACQ